MSSYAHLQQGIIKLEQERNAALEELAALKEEKRMWRGRMAFLEQIARDKQEENAALRLSSQAAASHRKALEELVSEYQNAAKEGYYLRHLHYAPKLFAELERRFAELSTTPLSELKAVSERTEASES